MAFGCCDTAFGPSFRAARIEVMQAIVPILIVVPVLSLAMAGAWAIARRPGKSGWTDVIWSYATGAGGIALALTANGAPLERRILVAVLIGGWSFRLGTHILVRTLKGKDDPRYLELRRIWGANWQWRLFLFLQIQAAAAVLLLVAVDLAALNPAPAPRWSDWAGVAVLAAAVVGEGVADRQLRRFAAESGNRGKVNDRGLWAWSRHPNYFFEWLGWWAYPLIAIGPVGQFGWSWAALIGPALIYVILVHGSGIPPTEAHMLRSRGAAFEAYCKRVNAFFPWPPRR